MSRLEQQEVPRWARNIVEDVALGCAQVEALCDATREQAGDNALVGDALGGIARLVHGLSDSLDSLVS